MTIYENKRLGCMQSREKSRSQPGARTQGLDMLHSQAGRIFSNQHFDDSRKVQSRIRCIRTIAY